MQGHIRYIRDENRRIRKRASARRVQDARAREIELRVAQHEGKLMTVLSAI
jgi:hypothetical protein